MQTSYRFSATRLRQIARKLFEAAGTPLEIAETVADILVNANLAGHDSHGVQFVPLYLDRIEKGGIDPGASPQVIQETASTMLVDGHNGFGHYMSRQAMVWAIDKTKQSAVCCVSFQNSTHIGRVGEYAEQAAKAGCIAVITSGAAVGAGGGQMAPFGGARGALGTNPIGVGVPSGDDAPFIIDFATSVIAGGKIMVAHSKNADLPAGSIVDKHGQPSVKTADFYDGGYLLPGGGHKGYALALLFSLLGGLAGHFDQERTSMGGMFMQVIDVAAFTPLEAYQQNVRALLDGLKTTPPAPGFDEVLVPGDFEHRSRRQRLAEGIDVPESTYRKIEEWADTLNVALIDEDEQEG